MNLIGKVTAGDKCTEKQGIFRFQKAKFKLVKPTKTDCKTNLEAKIMKAAGKIRFFLFDFISLSLANFLIKQI